MQITPYSPWWDGLICLYGQQDVHWEYPETDLDWWAVRFIVRNISN